MRALRHGDLVRVIGTDRVGLITEVVRKSGRNKGLVGVWYVGDPYEYSAAPEDLERVTLDGVTPVPAP